MASLRHKSTAPNGRQELPGEPQHSTRSNRDSLRWGGGIVLLFIGLFAAAAVLFSYFCWQQDQSGLDHYAKYSAAEDRAALGIYFSNPCGWLGAWIGQHLVDLSFGLFGILIPVMIMLLGVRIIRQKQLLLNHSMLSLIFVMILGSMTLGFFFSDKMLLGSSTGMGGAFGVKTAELLDGSIGVIGTIILLLVGWILTGVFINRNFINTVNAAGNAMVDRSEKIVGRMVHSRPSGLSEASEEEPVEEVAPRPAPRPAAPAAQPAQPVQPAPSASAASVAAAPVVSAAPVSQAAQPMPARPVVRPELEPDIIRPSEPEVAEPQAPFFPEEPIGETGGELRQAAAPEETTPEAGEEPAELFPETDLSGNATGRVVMGRGGLVELERPRLRASRPVPVPVGTPFEEVPNPADAAAGEAARPADQLEDSPEVVLSNLLDGEQLSNPDSPFTEEPVGEELPVPGAAGASDPFAAACDPLPFDAADPAELPETPVGADDSTFPEVPAEPAEPADAPAAPTAPAAAEAGGVVVTVEANEARMVDERQIPTESYDPLKDLMNYRKPSVTLLEDYLSDSEVSDEEIFENKTKIEETLKYFKIPIQRIRATVGPTVTLYEIVQAQGVKISRIQGLQNDIAQSLKAESGIRIIAPIPGRGTIGIEVPNRHKQVVSMYSAVRSMRFNESKAALPVVIGRTIQNENFVFDLAKMPHLLVAGATGMGKSVGLNAIITSLLYKMHPAQLKFVMIDPKMVEFSLYAKLERHFLAKMESEEEAIVTDPRKAVYTLNSLCTEMDNRLELCKNAAVRNIAEYNQKFTDRRLNPQKGHRFLPYIVVIIDEFADLIMTAKEVEVPVTRLAQKARAVGIHLIIATQRPSVDVITGKIKANFPARIAFRVMQMIDSRTILDRPGAEQLIGRGDLLISKDGELTRVQCALVDTPEVERIVDHISKQQSYASAYMLPDYTPDSGDGAAGMGSSEESSAPQKYDALFAEIAREAVGSGSISTSMIQRNYEVGFNRAGRIMLQLERAGIVGRQQGAKPREILFHDLPSLEAKLQEMGLF